MKLSEHAKSKLEIYGIDGEEVISKCLKPIAELFDTLEKSQIIIIELNEIYFIAIINESTKTIITVYRTDLTTINNRKKSNRWT